MGESWGDNIEIVECCESVLGVSDCALCLGDLVGVSVCVEWVVGVLVLGFVVEVGGSCGPLSPSSSEDSSVESKTAFIAAETCLLSALGSFVRGFVVARGDTVVW